ncbi:MAG: hypothetical protein LKM36_01190 [Flavobacteriales bacterium]|nr:hypothetical protein [Flavobacteriales bacterium]
MPRKFGRKWDPNGMGISGCLKRVKDMVFKRHGHATSFGERLSEFDG